MGRLVMLHYIADIIDEASDPLDVMRRILLHTSALVPGTEGAALEFADRDQLTYICATGTLAVAVGTSLSSATSLSGRALTRGEVLACADARTDERVDAETTAELGVRSMICVPLQRDGHPIGVLKVASAAADAFDSDDVVVLGGLADFISATVGAIWDISRTASELRERMSSTQRTARAGGDRAWDIPEQPGDEINEFVANVLRPGMLSDVEARRRVERVLASRAIRTVVQPILAIPSGELLGVEALSRFGNDPAERSPDLWFEDAYRTGLGTELEMAATRRALELVPSLPPDAVLTINVGAQAIGCGELLGLLSASAPGRIVLELTEHAAIDDYPLVLDALRVMREEGMQLAIDDMGAGFAGFGHVLNLRPSLIKLDRRFGGSLASDPVSRAVAQSLVSLANDIGAQVVAEGIETPADLDCATRLGIHYAQGYLLGRPAPLDEFLGADAMRHAA